MGQNKIALPVQMAEPNERKILMINNNTFTEFTQRMADADQEYTHRDRIKREPELEIVTKCSYKRCGVYLTTNDEIYIDNMSPYCGKGCALEDEKALEAENNDLPAR